MRESGTGGQSKPCQGISDGRTIDEASSTQTRAGDSFTEKPAARIRRLGWQTWGGDSLLANYRVYRVFLYKPLGHKRRYKETVRNTVWVKISSVANGGRGILIRGYNRLSQQAVHVGRLCAKKVVRPPGRSSARSQPSRLLFFGVGTCARRPSHLGASGRIEPSSVSRQEQRSLIVDPHACGRLMKEFLDAYFQYAENADEITKVDWNQSKNITWTQGKLRASKSGARVEAQITALVCKDVQSLFRITSSLPLPSQQEEFHERVDKTNASVEQVDSTAVTELVALEEYGNVLGHVSNWE
ncbi:hypothetical protein DFH06DRAFT_1129164 [Mycena polygramma]|nr:hypothetical protein DFH06DRAFT_1129164 [Mycena polygramma]